MTSNSFLSRWHTDEILITSIDFSAWELPKSVPVLSFSILWGHAGPFPLKLLIWEIWLSSKVSLQVTVWLGSLITDYGQETRNCAAWQQISHYYSQMKMALSVLRLDMCISFIVLKDLFQKLFSSSFPIILAVWEKWIPSLQLVAAVFLILETSLQPLCYVCLLYNLEGIPRT